MIFEQAKSARRIEQIQHIKELGMPIVAWVMNYADETDLENFSFKEIATFMSRMGVMTAVGLFAGVPDLLQGAIRYYIPPLKNSSSRG